MGIPTCVGCEEHSHELTRALMNFYLTTRMIFACKDRMKSVAEKKKLEKSLTKQSRLVHSEASTKKKSSSKKQADSNTCDAHDELVDDPGNP